LADRIGRDVEEEDAAQHWFSAKDTISSTARAEAAQLPGAGNCRIHAPPPTPSSQPFHRDSASTSKHSRYHQSKVQKE